MIKYFPLIFILLWSSAFISGKVIVQDATPFAALAFRFGIVTLGFLLYALVKKEIIFKKLRFALESITTGVLFHGFYLGGIFYAFYVGVPTGVVALIVTLQPILTNLLAGPIYKEEINWKQWVGIIFGFFGALLVLGIDYSGKYPNVGIITCFVALAGITIGTLWQKKLSGNLSLSVNNGFQALGGCLFNLILMSIFEDPFINFTKDFILGMSHQIILVSFGAFTILMFLIKAGSVSKTSTLFFLVPPTSAFMAYAYLGEKLSNTDIAGFIATRK